MNKLFDQTQAELDRESETSKTAVKSAEPSILAGVPTAMKIISAF